MGDNDTVDFDAFWAEYSESAPRQHVLVLGEKIDIPFDVPLELEQRMTAADTSDRQALANLLQEIYGEDVLERWTAKKMGVKQMAILVTWTLMRVQGGTLTLTEVANKMQELLIQGKLTTSFTNTGPQ